MHASLLKTAVTHSIHQLKIFILENALGASRWKPVLEASCEIRNCSRINWVQFDQVIVILFNQSIDASKTSKSFQDWADLFVVVGKLVEILGLALAVEDKSLPFEIS